MPRAAGEAVFGAERVLDALDHVVLPDDRVLVTGWEFSRMLKIARQGSGFTATELWRSPRLRGTMTPVVHRGGFLYFAGGGQLICAEAATGEVRWRERSGTVALAAAGPHLLLLSETSGDLVVVQPSPDRYREVIRTRVLAPDVRSVTGPSIAEGRVYLRNTSEIAAFGFEVASCPLPARIETAIAES